MSTDRLKEYYLSSYRQYAEDGPRSFNVRHPPRDRWTACLSECVARIRSGGHVLELGSDDGSFSLSVVAARPDLQKYVATELSTERCDRLRKNTKGTAIEVAAVDADELKSNDPTYDAIIMIALIEHLIDPIQCLSNVRRLLKPGGFVYLDTPNIAKYTRRIKLLCGYFPSTGSWGEGLLAHTGGPTGCHDDGHLHYFTFRSLEKIVIARCGFSKVERVPYFLGPSLVGHTIEHALATCWPSLFSELALVAYV